MPDVASPAPTSRSSSRGRFGRAQLLAAILVGGAAGALLRAALSDVFPTVSGGFPWTVLAVNVAGAVVLAYSSTRLQERLPPSTYRRPALGTGFCGALTTFSTLQVGAVELGRSGHAVLAVAYLAASLLAGLLAAIATTGLTRRARLR